MPAKSYMEQRLASFGTRQAFSYKSEDAYWVTKLAGLGGLTTTSECNLTLATAVAGEASHFVSGYRQSRNLVSCFCLMTVGQRGFVDRLGINVAVVRG